MKYIEEFRDSGVVLSIAAAIAREAHPARSYRFMEFCGGHTHVIFRHGLQDLLPRQVQMVHGPGCPVCVLPACRLDMAIELAGSRRAILCTYGDMLRVPGSDKSSLLKARAAGADVRMIHSTLQALGIAQENPARQVVFFAIGFETTTPPTAVAIQRAAAIGLRNFSVFCNHVLTPPAIQSILESPQVRGLESVTIDGFVGPAHVSVVIGSRPYEYFASEYQRPVVIAGFEPLDVMTAILMLVRQVNAHTAEVQNEYTRAVTRDGNRKAQRLVAEIFELRRSFEWRGLGIVPYSALKIKKTYADFDAEARFAMREIPAADNPSCECGAVLRGVKKPLECRLFGSVCTPDNPIGSCMVSPEGACAAYYMYRRFTDQLEKEIAGEGPSAHAQLQ